MTDRFASNPFSSRFIRPGAMPFHFPAGESLERILCHLEQHRGCGTIVGPHGSGKSTLLCALMPELHRRGWQTNMICLHDRQRRLPTGWQPKGVRPMLVVDGFEQLSGFGRWRLARVCRGRRWGLLVTSHEPTRLPTVYRTGTSVALMSLLVNRLTCTAERRPSESVLTAAYVRVHGNLREAFFALYDEHERAAPRRTAGPYGPYN